MAGWLVGWLAGLLLAACMHAAGWKIWHLLRLNIIRFYAVFLLAYRLYVSDACSEGQRRDGDHVRMTQRCWIKWKIQEILLPYYNREGASGIYITTASQNARHTRERDVVSLLLLLLLLAAAPHHLSP